MSTFTLTSPDIPSGGTVPQQAEVPGCNHFDVILALAQRGTVLGDATLRLLGR